MRRMLAWVLGLTMGASAICAESLAANKGFYKKLESKIRSLDDWVADYVQSDLDKADKKVKIKLMSDNDPLRGAYIRKVIACYIQPKNTLILPDRPRKQAEILEAIPHELMHAIHHDIAENREFTAPALLDKIVITKAMDPKYESIRLRLCLEEEAELLNNAKACLDYCRYSITSAWRFAEANQDIFLKINTSKRERLLQGSLGTLNNAIREKNSFNRQKEIHDELDSILCDNRTTIAQMVRVSDVLRQNSDTYDECDSLAISTYHHINEIWDTYLEVLKKARKRIPRGMYLRKKEDILYKRTVHQNIIEDIGQSKVALATQNIKGIFDNPDEVLARAAASLCNLYFGRDDILEFRLDEEWLGILETIKRDGKPIFAKMIEKYETGLMMIEEGMKPSEVQHQLRYTYKMEYKGKTYIWQENNYRIKGTLKFEE